MKKRMFCILCALVLLAGLLTGCKSQGPIKIGVSFGVGPAVRWPLEQGYMEAYGKELGIEVETRLNLTDTPLTQEEDCKELIDSGIDVLVLIPRDVNHVSSILEYAEKKNVPVISYARVVLGSTVDLFVGYDSSRIGQSMGQYLSEMVYEGDYILLQGDAGDNNATLLYDGAMRYISNVKNDINILLDAPVPGWDPATAKQMVMDAVAANGNHVDAILAPNDKIAGACVKALAELGVTEHVVITGMDAELDALKRIVAGTQDITFYMDLNDLARTCIDEAVHLAKGEKTESNSEFPNESETPVPSHLITGQLVTKENLDKILIESGYYTHEEIYGE